MGKYVVTVEVTVDVDEENQADSCVTSAMDNLMGGDILEFEVLDVSDKNK